MTRNIENPPALVQKDTRRAETVLAKIENLSQTVSAHSLDLAELLTEARQNDYHKVRGFSNFEDYVAQAKLGIGKRSAFYYIKIWDGADKLTIPREELEAAGISKLKVIFGLDIEKFEPEIRELVKIAPALTVEELTDRVKALKQPEEDKFTFFNMKVLREDGENECRPALEAAKAYAGDTIDIHTKESKSLSDGQAFVHICQSFNQDPNNMVDQLGVVGTFEDEEAEGKDVG